MDQHKNAVWHRMLEGREKGIEGIKGVTCKSFADISERSSYMTRYTSWNTEIATWKTWNFGLQRKKALKSNTGQTKTECRIYTNSIINAITRLLSNQSRISRNITIFQHCLIKESEASTCNRSCSPRLYRWTKK